MGSGGMIGFIAIYLFMTIQQMGATKCKSTPVFTGSPSKTASPISVTISSLLENYRAEYCMDGDINTFCHTKVEENPFLLLEYAKQIKVNEVKVTVRKKHGFARAKEMIVVVTDIKPTKGQIATTLGTQLGATFKGPATKGGQVISFKASSGAMGKYVVVQQLYKGVMNLAEIQINPPVVSMSSQLGVTIKKWGNYPAENCVDGDVDTFCHTETEENRYFMVEMTEPIEVTDVKVTVRKNCCWERVKQMVVIVTKTAPTREQLASGLQLGETFIGPATYSAQVITFKSKTAITGKYVIVQQKYKGSMNLAEVQVNNDHDTTLYMKKWKNSYTNCIQNPECGGCIDIVQKRLPELLQENIIKEGEIGVNNGLMEIGSKHGSTKREIETRAQTLTLRKVGDIKTIRTDNEMVTINGTVNGIVGGKRNYAGTRRRLTGLYAAPGDLVTITFPEELIGKVTLDINTVANAFKLSFSVKTSLCKIGSPWGGLINFNMKSKDSYKGTFKVNFTNAVKAPTFIYNVTTNEQWNKIRNYSPKWAALIVPGQVEIIVQTLKIKDITDMEEAISRIKLTMDALEDMLGLPAGSRPGAETLDFDPVGGGWGEHGGGCSGGFNRVGDHFYTEDKVTDYKYYDDFFKEFGTNGIVLHEFGHGYCYNDLPSEGDHWYVETVSQYIHYIRGATISPLAPEMTSKDLDWDLLYRMVGFSMNSKGKPCGEFFNKPEENAWYYTCWKWIHFIPSRIHGWHAFKDVHTLNAMSTKNYNSKTDRLVDLYCQATKHNMLPMFNFYNIKPSEEAITKNCKKLPESEILTKWLNIVECVKQSMSHVNKDIKDCAKMPRFPHHKGLCLISGVCRNDDTNNGNQTTMIEKFDLYGSTGSKEFMSKKKSSENKKNCLNRAEDFFQDCNNEMDQPITAFFYEKEQGYEIDKFNFTFPQPGPFISSQLNKDYPAKKCMDGDKDTFCHTKIEENPFFVFRLSQPIEITQVKVTVRKGCCWERAKQMVVIVTNTAPTKGKLASGLQLGETFIGPATSSAQVITFKSKTAITGKYVIVQQQYKGSMNLAEVQVNNGTGSFASARSSSIYANNLEKYGPYQSIDGVSFFHSKQENYPWLELKLWEPTEVSDVTIINRKDCCGERLKDAVIRTGMSKVPDGTKNQLLTTNQVCGTYRGPAATGETVKIVCSQPIKAEYITIQLNSDNGILQIKQVGINSD